MIQDFFEGNSITYEVFELFEELREEKQKRPALRATFRQMKEDYAGEPGEYIIVLMSVYYCGLKNAFEDLKFKKELEALTKNQILACFGDEDGTTVAAALEELLKLPPDPPVRKKIDYSNPGSKNWKPGDLYAYRLRGEEVEKAGLAGKYAVLYCADIQKETARQNNVSLYILICDKETLQKDPKNILKNSFCLPSQIPGRRYWYYMFMLVSYHHEYPMDDVFYVGTSLEFIHPNKERLYPDKLYISRLIWKWFDDLIAKKYEYYLKCADEH